MLGEIMADPHMVTAAAVDRRAAATGFRLDRRLGGRLWHYTRLTPA